MTCLLRTIVISALAVPIGFAATLPPFQFNIQDVQKTKPGELPEVTFFITNPNTGQRYDIFADLAFRQSGVSRVFVQIGWDTADYNNTGGVSHLAPAGNTGPPPAAALPIGINTLTPSTVVVGDRLYKVVSRTPIPLTATGSGVAAMEGRVAILDPVTNTYVSSPVKNVFRSFAITGTTATPRRVIVDIASKCNVCHGNLAIHGNNRSGEAQVCVICHNPNATDIAYRRQGDGPEVPIDFKSMVHGIHASMTDMRRSNPLKVMGFGHVLTDFSTLGRFPGGKDRLRNCETCHLAGTYKLPLGANVLGTTVTTQSVIRATMNPAAPTQYLQYNTVDNDPTNDLNITPTAAVCSGCHVKSDARRHMESTGGASFAALQQQIGSQFRERCVNCHGPGKEKDIARVHR